MHFSLNFFKSIFFKYKLTFDTDEFLLPAITFKMIIGLGLGSPPYDAKSLVDNLKDQGHIQNKIFSFWSNK